jgi:enoyl-CoA hydratase/carnithine racemase
MTSEQMVRFKRKEGLAIVTLANPDFNRINHTMLSGLQKVLAQIRQPDVCAVLLKAEGEVFSYSADVKDLFVNLPAAELP